MFESVDVLIQYRYDAGATLPTSRQLIARVFQKCGDQTVYGDDLIVRYTSSVSVAEDTVVRKLRGKTRRIVFHYDPPLEKQEMLRQIA